MDTKQPEHGDYASSAAMAMSKQAGKNSRELAARLRDEILAKHPVEIQDIEIAGPGFLNFRLKPESIASSLTSLFAEGNRIGHSRARAPLKINIEFVSVNPNGPITVGSGRGAAFGDTLCRVLEAAGHQVHREYYINDGVNSEQMRVFAESVRHYYLEAGGSESSFPEKGYKGDYVQGVAQAISEAYGEGEHDRDLAWFQSESQQMMLQRQASDLAAFGVRFDTWYSEQGLHDSGTVMREVQALIDKCAADEKPERTVLKMAKGGIIAEVEKQPQTVAMETEESDEPAPGEGGGNTLWLRSTKFGDDMDRVLRRRDGRLTYIASDVAYHKDKLTDASGVRGTGPVDKLITILGPDHHGYIHRLQAVLAALLENPDGIASGWGDSPQGAPPRTSEPLSEIDAQIYESPEERDACRSALREAKEKLEVVIFQIVRFMQDGKPAPMRKRDGNIYELRDLINELGESVAPATSRDEQARIGADVARFFYLMRSHDTHMDFDIDLAKKSSDDNPVFYVQYAHARIASVLRKAHESGLTSADAETKLLDHPRELALIKKILDLQPEIQSIARDYGVHRLTTFAIELSRMYHHFYDACRVVQPDQPELSAARILLCEVIQNTLRSALNLLGISAPEKMYRYGTLNVTLDNSTLAAEGQVNPPGD